MLRRLYQWLPLLPIIGVGVFIAMYGSATPLTDEWNFMQGAMRLSHARTLDGMSDSIVWYSYSHCVVVPFVFFYVPLEFLTGFDSRALMALTVLCHASMLITLARRFSPPPFLLFCASLVLFSPARYVELLWGFEFTLAMSIAFSVWGLFVLDKVRVDVGLVSYSGRVICAFLLFVAGVLSSAGGHLGFVAALVVLAIKPIPWRTKLVTMTVLAAAGFALYSATIQFESDLHFGGQQVLQIATCAGGALLSSPIAIERFWLNVPALLGGAMLLISVVSILRAAQLRILGEAAFGIGLIAYGVLSVAAIAVNRTYIANWHLEYILPTITGTLVLTWLVWKRSGKNLDLGLCGAIVVATFCGLYGWSYGFKTGGPEFSAYVREIERYIVTYDRDPGQPMPFPPMGPWAINSQMTTFLREVEHPVFEQRQQR